MRKKGLAITFSGLMLLYGGYYGAQIVSGVRPIQPLLVACKKATPQPEEDTEAPSTVIDFQAETGDDSGKINLSWKEGTDNEEVVLFTLGRGPIPNLDPYDPLHQPYITAITDADGLQPPIAPGTVHTLEVSGLNPGQRYFFQIAQADQAGNVSGFVEVEGIAGGVPPISGVYWGNVGTLVADGSAVDGLDGIVRNQIDTKKTVATPSGDVHFGQVTNDGGNSYYIIEVERYQNGLDFIVNCPAANRGATTTLASGSYELNLTSGLKSLSMGIAPRSLAPTNNLALPTQMAEGIEWLLKMPDDVRSLYTNLPKDKQLEYISLSESNQLDFLLNQYQK